MNITNLRTFVAVIDNGSLSAAARSLGISQPAVTMQLQALEADLGVTLVDRRYRRMDLTEAGQVLEPHARRVVGELQNAREEIGSLSGSLTGTLRVAASTTPGAYIIPRALGAFIAKNPDVQIIVTSNNTAGVVEAVESGKVHLGVAGAMVKGARVVFLPLLSDDLIAICSPSSPLASRKKVSLAELAEQIFVRREPGSGTRQAVERALAQAGVDVGRVRVAAQLGSGGAIIEAVAGGLGIGIVARLTAEMAIESGRVVRVNVDAPPISRQFYLVFHKGTPTRAASAFAAHLEEFDLKSR
jgi:DNA-binding transcriptional LysR family regulator